MPLPPQPPPELPPSREIPALHQRRLLNLSGLGKISLGVILAGITGILMWVFLVQIPVARFDGYASQARTIALDIGIECQAYATDHTGQFPGGTALALGKPPRDSNAAFQELLDGKYALDDTYFWVRDSSWCRRSTNTGSNVLDPGENAYAYFLQPRGSSAPSQRPLIATAWMPGTSAVYARSPKIPGYGYGPKGRQALVIKVDGSGDFMDIDSRSQTVIDENTEENALWPNASTGFNADAIPLLPR